MPPRTIRPLETIPIQQRQKKLEILFFPRMRRCRHQEEMLRPLRQHPAQRETLGGFHFPIPRCVVGAHPVRLIDNRNVPAHCTQLIHQLLVTRDLVHPNNQVRVISKHIATSRLDHRHCQNIKRESKLRLQLILPLISQTTGRHDERTFTVGTQHHFFQVQPRHDSFPSTRIIRQQESQRDLREHMLINSTNLVGKRLDIRRRHRSHRVVQRCIFYTQSLCCQHKFTGIRIIFRLLTVSIGNHDMIQIVRRQNARIDGAGTIAENHFRCRLPYCAHGKYFNVFAPNHTRETHPGSNTTEPHCSSLHAFLIALSRTVDIYHISVQYHATMSML